MKHRLQAIVGLALKSHSHIIRITNGFADTVIELEIDGFTNKVREKLDDYKLIPYLRNLTHFYKKNGCCRFNYYLDGNKTNLEICFLKRHYEESVVLNLVGPGSSRIYFSSSKDEENCIDFNSINTEELITLFLNYAQKNNILDSQLKVNSVICR